MRLEDHPVLHHEADALQRWDIRERIALDRYQVGVGSGRDPSELGAHVEELGGTRGRRLDRLHGRHPELDLSRKFLGDGVRPYEAADVGAEGDLDTSTQRLLKGDAMHGDSL